jgi:hypothetical protein
MIASKKRLNLMKIAKKPTLHFFLLLTAFIIALAFRLIRLGQLPLNNQEADLALQALAIAQGNRTSFGSHIAYVGLTGLNFFVFNSSNFLARFWPAFIGALIVFVPYFFRNWIGWREATLLSLLLAFSPDMVGLSRVIGSPMMAFVCLLLGLGLFLKRKPILSGLFLALSLMSGPGFWMGSLVLGISFFISKRLFNVTDTFDIVSIKNKRRFWLTWGSAFLVTLFLVGTGFFMAPAGLSGILAGLVSFIQGFGVTYVRPYILLPLTLFTYTAPALILGIWGGIRGFVSRNKLDMFLSLWAIVGFIFVLVYPGSLPVDLVWVTLPLWILAVRAFVSSLRLPDTSRFVLIIAVIVVIVISAFMMLTLRSLLSFVGQPDQQITYLIAMIGGGVLLLAFILLISFGWSQTVAMPGFLIGLAIVISAGLISVSVTSSGLNPERSYEWWYPNESYISPEWLSVSIDRIIDWNASGGSPVDIAVVVYDSPAMRWALRNYDPVHFVPYLSPQSQFGLLITDATFAPEIADSYRGQDLVWSREVLWETLTPLQYLNWLVTRQISTAQNQIILWVRTDLMPDAQFSN